ncbi:hypothetical protein ABEX89_08995 [Bacillus velezensis]|uniref:hypothetical protein n=1 Tax=Bacillus TaxID=1386 RepID=UPI000648577E|nr:MULTISPECIES: hypothetical protein [Bacillus]MCX2851373.1 hypothetical protein [Bacillus sp. KeR2]UBM47566.1 hypothetical protein LAZ98_09185 [Bacillus velezensis]
MQLLIGIISNKIFIILALLLFCLYIKNKYPFFVLRLIVNILIYLFEAYLGSLIVMKILGYVADGTVFSSTRDMIFSYTTYQLILFFSLKIYDSLIEDALVSIKTSLYKIENYITYNQTIPSEYLQFLEKIAQNKGVDYKKEHRELLKNIVELTRKYNSSEMKTDDIRMRLRSYIINIEHDLSMLKFSWSGSLFLRIVK